MLQAPPCGFEPLIERVMTDVSAAAGLAGVPPPWLEQKAPLGTLLDLVLRWNRSIDLTAARSPEELVDLFVADAALLAALEGAGRRLEPGPRWVDVGSGGGAPGLALALLHPGLSLTLVEPRGKRVSFLRSAVGTLGLTAVRVVRGRCEDLAEGSWELASSRATLAPADWLSEGVRLATCAVWVLLARASSPSQRGWCPAQDVRYAWPLTGAERRAIRFVPVQDAREERGRARG
jgi:16S rRNA (guanine527-N7)-methyltransferase